MSPYNRVVCCLLCLLASLSTSFAGIITVTNNADAGPGSFRDALTQAAVNGIASRDSIIFSIADNSLAGRTITLQSALPALSGNLVINGSSQGSATIGVSDAQILLLLSATAGNFNFLTLQDISDVAIYGMAMISTVNSTYTVNGIQYVRCRNLQIGRARMGNYILGCSNGINCSSPWYTFQYEDSSRNLIIQSNIVGLDMNGGLTGMYNGMPVAVGFYPLFLSETFDIMLGGDHPADGNSFFGGAVAAIWNGVAHNNGYLTVEHNNFGTKKNGTMDPGNYTPVMLYIAASGGDYLVSCANNHFHGSILLDELKNYFTIQGNTIWGATNQSNFFTGVEISNCYGGGLIGGDGPGQGNNIYNSFSDYFGSYFTPVYIQTSIRTVGTSKISIKKNISTCNNFYGSTIELYQPGPNAPVVQVDSTGVNFVRGKATPNSRIDIYLDDDCYACEGKQWLGLTMSNADSSWAFNGSFNAAVVATATATDGTTSMFSQPNINNTGLSIKQPSCGKNNGYIKGMQTTGSDHAQWHKFHQVAGNWVDSIASDNLELVNASPGVYYFDAWIGKNCRSAPLSYTLQAVSVKLDTSAILKNNPVCGKFNGSIKGITVNTTQDLQIVWKNEQGKFISNQLDLDGQGPGKYKLVVTDTVGGCMDSSFLYELSNQSGPTVNINTAVVVPASCTGSDGSISQISFSNISGTPSYSWYNANNQLVGNAPDLSQVPAGEYTLKFKDGSSCDTIITSAIPVPVSGGISFDSSAVAILITHCSPLGSIRGMKVFNADTYTWINTGSGIIAGHGMDLPNAVPGNYKLIASNSLGCRDSTGIFYVSGQSPPVMDSSRVVISPEVCGLSDGSLTGLSVQGQAPVSYEWFSLAGNSVAQTADLYLVPAGQYYLRANDANNCAVSSNLFSIPSKTVQPDPPDYDDIVIIRNSAAVLHLKNQQAGNYFLYASPAAITADQQNTTGDFSTRPLFHDTAVYVKLQQGTCESTVQRVKIQVLQTTQVVMPNVFSPNHDGRNELFRLPHPQMVLQMQLAVFNRWGQKVFETEDPYQGWSGTDQPAGTYVWTMTYTDVFGKKQKLNGSLVLIR